MTLSIFVAEDVKVIDVLVGAVKRVIRAVKNTFSLISSLLPKLKVLVRANGNKAPPVGVQKGGNKKAL